MSPATASNTKVLKLSLATSSLSDSSHEAEHCLDPEEIPVLQDEATSRYFADKYRYQARMMRMSEASLSASEEVFKELAILKDSEVAERASGFIKIVQYTEFADQLMKELSASYKDSRKIPEANRKLSYQYVIGKREMSDQDVKTGEILRRLGAEILGVEFKSCNPAIILEEELHSYMYDAFSEIDMDDFANALASNRNRLRSKFQSRMARGATTDAMEVYEDALKKPGSGRQKSKGTERANHLSRLNGPNGERTRAAARSAGKVARDINQLLARDCKSSFREEVLGSLARATRQLSSFAYQQDIETPTSLDPALLKRLEEAADTLEQAVAGSLIDYKQCMNGLSQISASLREDVNVLYETVAEFESVIPSLRLSRSKEALPELARARADAMLLAPRFPAPVFMSAESDTRINDELARAILRYNFAREQSDQVEIDKNFELIDGFQRREVRAALQEIYHRQGLIEESSYEALRYDCGKHRTAPEDEIREETPEEQEQRQLMERLVREERELVYLTLSDYCSDEMQLHRLSEAVAPDTIDNVFLSLRSALQGGELADAMLMENPEIFRIAQEEPDVFRAFAYDLLSNTTTIVQKMSDDLQSIARYSDPYTLEQQIEFDKQQEKNQRARQLLSNALARQGLNLEVSLAILKFGFLGRGGQLATTLTYRSSEEEVFDNLRERIENFEVVRDSLRGEYERLLAAKVIIGTEDVAINLHRGKKKSPTDSAFKRLVEFTLAEVGQAAPTFPISLSFEK